MRNVLIASLALLAATGVCARTVTVNAVCPNGDRVVFTKTNEANAITVNGTSFSRSGGTGQYITRYGETATVQYAGDAEGYQVAVAMTPDELKQNKFALIGWNTTPQECTITSRKED